MPSVEVNPVKLQLLEMRSPTARVSHCLQHFSALRKTPGTRPGGKTWPGLKHIKGKDYDRIAIKLLETEWSGQFSGSGIWVMATEIQDLLKIKDLTFKEKWQLGRVLISALCYAGVYKQDKEARGAEPGFNLRRPGRYRARPGCQRIPGAGV